MSASGENLLTVLRAGLAAFREQVEKEPGRLAASLGPAPGTVPDVIRTVLEAVANALAWLAGALDDVAALLKVADSAAAMLESATDMLAALSSGFSFGDLPAALGLEPGPFLEVEQAVARGHDVMAKGHHLLGLCPRTEDLDAIRKELEALLGHRVNPANPGQGSLGKLLARVETNTPRGAAASREMR